MKEVIILGCGFTNWDCPYDCETWGVNASVKWATRLDKLFFFDDMINKYDPKEINLHDLKETKAELISTEKNAEYCKQLGIDIKVFPLEEICEKFNNHYFSNTINYMIAYALYKGYKKLRLYGIDHIRHETYTMERSGVEFWLGIAVGMGVEVEIAEGSALLQTFNGKLYGYQFFYEDYLKDGTLKPKENLIIA